MDISRVFLILGTLFITISIGNPTLAFKPGAKPCAPPRLAILQHAPEIVVKEYSANIKIIGSTAEVNAKIKLIYTGDLPKTYDFSLYIFSKQAKVLLNDKPFKYSYQNKEFSYTFAGCSELVIRADYQVDINYLFSGPPGPWVCGYVLEVGGGVSEGVEGKEKDKWLWRQQKKIAVCEVNVECPSDFQLSGLALKPLETDGRLLYSLKNRDQYGCPFVTFSKKEKKKK
jgi:hypothetical protein